MPRFCTVHFDNSTRPYIYFCPFPEARVGDRVSVPSGGKATIVEFHELEEGKSFRPLSGLYDRETGAIIRPRPQAKPSLDRRESILKELQARKELIDIVAFWKPLARKDKVIARLVKELEAQL